jgi:ABC-type multidrug transport system fused ATPase/permease subunit
MRIWQAVARLLFPSTKDITLSPRIFEQKFHEFCFVRIINVMASLLEVRGLSVELPTPAGWVRPVNEVSLRIGAGESLGLVGESGSGKTMLSLVLMGLLPPGARVYGPAPSLPLFLPITDN